MPMHEQWWLHCSCLSVSGGGRCHWVSMCTVWLSHSKWPRKYSNKSASNFVLSLNILQQTRLGWFRRPQLWAAGDWQLHHNNMPAHASCLMQSCLVKNPITQVTQHPYSPDLAPCDFWLFPKPKSLLKRKRFQTINEIQENTTGQLIEIGRTVWGPKVPTLEGTEPSLAYVQCFWYLVSSSINVSYIFHITWLDTFWTALVYEQMYYVILILQTLHIAKADSWVPRQCPHAHLYSISIFLKNNSRHLYSFSVAHWKSTNVPIKNVFDYKQQKIWLLVAETDWVAYFSHIGERCLMVFVQWLSTTMSWLMTQILLAFPSSSQMVCEAQDYHLCIKR